MDLSRTIPFDIGIEAFVLQAAGMCCLRSRKTPNNLRQTLRGKKKKKNKSMEYILLTWICCKEECNILKRACFTYIYTEEKKLIIKIESVYELFRINHAALIRNKVTCKQSYY